MTELDERNHQPTAGIPATSEKKKVIPEQTIKKGERMLLSLGGGKRVRR